MYLLNPLQQVIEGTLGSHFLVKLTGLGSVAKVVHRRETFRLYTEIHIGCQKLTLNIGEKKVVG